VRVVTRFGVSLSTSLTFLERDCTSFEISNSISKHNQTSKSGEGRNVELKGNIEGKNR
jgi:hypothetical protein